MSEPDATTFSEMIVSAKHDLHLDDLQLARLFKVSVPTIGRMIRGVSVPHPLARNAMDAVIAEIRDA